MNDIEAQLKSARLVTPSTDLDRRVNALFAGHARRPKRRSSPWWLGIAVAVGGAAVLVTFSTHHVVQMGESDNVIVRQLAPGDPVRALLQAPSSASPAPRIVVQAAQP